MTTMMIGSRERTTIAEMVRRAKAHPVDVEQLAQQLRCSLGVMSYQAQMTSQSVWIPINFLVSFSIEVGHPTSGWFRHMSISLPGAVNRVPSREAAWMMAEELGFVGDLEKCLVFIEKMPEGSAINVIQKVRE